MKNDIKDVQKIELEILNEFKQICEKENLRYFLFAGTLLGAVRHQGFIPWDDDVDVVMPRKDYDRFLEIAQSKLPDFLFLQTFNTDDKYINNFAKLRNINTTMIENSVKKLEMNHGIYMDIFPLDGIPDNKIIRKIYYFHLRSLIRMQSYFYEEDSNYRIKPELMLKRFVVKKCNEHNIKLKIDELMRKNDYDKCKCVASLMSNYREKAFFDKKIFKGVCMLPFEGISFACPSGYVELMTQLYGDYLELPPEDKRGMRHNHYIVDTENSFIKYV